MARHTYDYTKAGGFKTLEQMGNHRLKEVSIESGVKVHRRIYHPTEFFRTLNENTVSFQRISAKRQMAAMPLDATEGHIHHRKVSRSGFQLARPHELHLHGW
jgi:hypothetical protein